MVWWQNWEWYGGRIGNGMVVELGMAWWQNWEWYGGRIGNGVVVELEMVWWQNWEWCGSRIGNGVVVAGNSLQQDKVVGFWHQTSYFTQHS